MAKTAGTPIKPKRALARVVAASCAVVFLLLLGVVLLAPISLRIPAAAHGVSRRLTDYLHYPVSVAGLSLTGGTISINGLTIGNPAGFTGEALVSCRSIAVTPDWLGFLRGRKSFAEITVQGGRIGIGRNGRGEWNFHELVRRLSEKKGGGETLIRRLSISDTSLAVEGVRLDHLALTVRDLSTKGTTDSRFLLSWKDAGGSPFRIEGSARLGAVPSVEAALTAPSFSLQTLAGSLGPKTGPLLANGTGALDVTLKLQGGSAAVTGKLGVAGLALEAKDGRIPLRGELACAARYDAARDEATLDTCTVSLDHVVRLRASGTVSEVRKGRRFAARISCDSVDLKALSALLPPGLRRDLAVGGTLSATELRFAGDSLHGITAGGGTFFLRRGTVARGEKPMVSGLAADASLARVKEGWELKGRLRQEGESEGVLQELSAPFTVALSSRLIPKRAELPSVAATVYGIPAEGTLDYRPGGLSFRLDARKVPLSRLSRALPGKGVAFSAGTATLSLRGSGSSLREVTGKLTAEIADLKGSAAGRNFAVKGGATEAVITRSSGTLGVVGRIRWNGGLLDGKRMDGACSYGVRDGEFSVADGVFTVDRTELRVTRVGGLLPIPARAGETTRLPVHLAFSGIGVRTPLASLDGLSGKAAADYVTTPGKRWLEGSGAVAVGRLSWKGTEVGALDGGVKFTAAGAAADIRGKLFDGRLTGSVSVGLFDRERKTGFSLKLEQARCAALAAFTPGTSPVRGTGGVLDVRLTGGYDRTAGLSFRLEGDGTGIALAGKDGKTVLANGGVRTVCDLAGGTLVIREGVVTVGSAVTLKGEGKVASLLSPDREGDISLAFVTTPLKALTTTFAEVLPTGLREASASGSVSAIGRVRMAHRDALLEGTVSLYNGGLEITSQKFSMDGMTGTLPFSLDLTGTAAGRPERRTYSRDTYPAALAALRQAAATGHNVTIGRVRLGGMEFGKTTLAVRAGKGLTELTSLESSLFDGALLGAGFFRYGKKPEYGADLTVNGLSLRALCDANPKIKGYISGRVDGIVSLYGEGKGMNGLRGFTEIWTRSAHDEKMLVSKEFLQKLAGRKFKGLFFRNDRPYDRGEIRGYLENGFLTFDTLDISHTNFLGIRDLSVTVAPVQNRISLVHLYASIREAATRGKPAGSAEPPPPPPPAGTEFKWEE